MRTQIALDAEQHARVKQKAARMGITMAEYIRRLVARDLDSVSPEADPDSIIGIGSSGGSDIAAEGKAAIVAAAVAGRRASR
ncbi:MAG: ribbon-helix-helix protein, CopG family [Acidimicrobiia bacterium]